MFVSVLDGQPTFWMENKIKFKKQDKIMEKLHAKQFELRLLHDDLKGKLSLVQSGNDNHKLYVQRVYENIRSKQTEKVQKSLAALNRSVERISKRYEAIHRSDGSSSFFYKQQIEDVFLEEESFTGALTAYTRKQFFDGIAELAGSRDQSKYDLLDINKPETLLIKGDTEDIKLKEQDELRRLQSQYRISEEIRLKSEMSLASLRKSVETAEKQLKLLETDRVNSDNYKSSQVNLSKNILQKKNEILKCYESEVIPLLDDLQGLHGTKVIRGNYDLKIARQDYFLSKQSEVINQLLLQCSRSYFLSMLYEIELKEHRKSYHLLASSKSLLEKEISGIEKRIMLLKDPILRANTVSKETISSRDGFINKLYEALVPSTGDNPELYRTYDSIVDQSKSLSGQLSSLSTKHNEASNDKRKQIEALKATIKSTQDMVTKQQQGMKSKLSGLIEKLEEDLVMAEVQVNDIIKDVMTKKKMLASDSLKELERSIFPNFFNDPARLKRTINEIESRVKACTQDPLQN